MKETKMSIQNKNSLTGASATAALATGDAHSLGSRFLAVLFSRSTILVVAALLLILYFHQQSDGLFLTPTNASLLLRQTAVVAVVASGMTVLLIMGQFDLSVGSAAFFSGMVVAFAQVQEWGLVPSILAGVAVGLMIGLIQGLVITTFAVPAFIVTLAGFLLWRGLGLWITNAVPIGPVSDDFIGLTEGTMPLVVVIVLAAGVLAAGVTRMISARGVQGLSRRTSAAFPILAAVLVAAAVIVLGQTQIGLPNALLWVIGIAAVLGGLLGRAKLGRRIFLLGSNAESAVYAGINSKRILLIGFLIMGAIYGIAGTMLTARAGVSSSDAGMNLELTAIAAAVIGGTSLRGGIGTIRGAILGAVLLATIDNGMSLLGVSSYAQDVVKAIILVIAVALDGFFRRRQTTR